MRAFEFLLVEAQGGMWDRMLEKKSGANIQFLNGNQTYELVDVAVFPQDQRLKYESDPADPENPENVPVAVSELMRVDIEQYVASLGATVQKYIGAKNNSGAAMIVVLGDQSSGAGAGEPEAAPAAPAGKKIAFVKFFKEKKSVHPPIYWQTSVFSKETGWSQTGKGKSATAKAAEVQISPYDFVKPGRYQISALPGLVTQNLNSRPPTYPQNLKVGLPALLDDLIKNTGPVPNLEQYADQIEVVFGETAAPIALALGKRVSGAYKDAEANLLGKLKPARTWADFKEASFGAFGEKIGDSFLWAGAGEEATKIIISSKNKSGGAAASLTGAMETIDKYPGDFGPTTPFAQTYNNILPALKILHEEQAIAGVLLASVSRGIINDDERKYILEIYGKSTGTEQDLQQFPNLPTVYKAKSFIGSTVVNAKGQEVISKQGVDLNNPKWQMGYHLLGNCAKLLKTSLNKDTTLMTDFFKAVLNKAAMVQVYTNTERSGNGIKFSDFNVVWPPTFTGKIVIESDHYTSNAKPSKKISFKFD
jgi:hypothetical protein